MAWSWLLEERGQNGMESSCGGVGMGSRLGGEGG